MIHTALLRYLAHPGWWGLTPAAKATLAGLALDAFGTPHRAGRALGIHPDAVRYTLDPEHRRARRERVYAERAGADRGSECSKSFLTRRHRRHALAPDGRTVCGRRWAPEQHSGPPCRICARRVPKL